MPDQAVNRIAADARGGIWVGTNRGLIAWRDGSQKLFTSADGLSHYDVSGSAS